MSIHAAWNICPHHKWRTLSIGWSSSSHIEQESSFHYSISDSIIIGKFRFKTCLPIPSYEILGMVTTGSGGLVIRSRTPKPDAKDNLHFLNATTSQTITTNNTDPSIIQTMNSKSISSPESSSSSKLISTIKS